MKRLILSILLFLICFAHTLAWGGTYYVRAGEWGTWGEAAGNCGHSVDGPSNPCGVGQANSGAAAGDTIVLQDDGGDYATGASYTIGGISSGDPIVASGEIGNWIVWQAEGYGTESSDTPVLDSSQYGVFLNGLAYHHLKGITFNINANKWVSLMEDTAGTDTNHIVIEDCTFVGTQTDNDSAIRTDYAINNLVLKNNTYIGTRTASLYNWVFISSAAGKTVSQILIDGNTCGDALSHECIGIYSTATDDTSKIIIRNNTLQNKIHTVVNIYANSGNPTNILVENNSIFNSGALCGYDTDYSSCAGVGEWDILYDNGQDPDQARERKTAFSNAASESIIRFNKFYNNGVALQLNAKAGTTSQNKYIYRNTFYKNVHAIRVEHISVDTHTQDHWFINNIFRDNTELANSWSNRSVFADLGSGVNSNIYFTYNLADEGSVLSDYDNTIDNFNDLDVSPGSPAWANNEEGSALFVNETTYDFNLQTGSAAIDAGGALTLANGSGNGTTLVVDDSTPFHDGSWCPDADTLNQAGLVCQADSICIGGTSSCSAISSISTNTITLVSSLSWSDNDPVYFHKDSDGTQVLYGTAPDMGVYEFRSLPAPRNFQ